MWPGSAAVQVYVDALRDPAALHASFEFYRSDEGVAADRELGGRRAAGDPCTGRRRGAERSCQGWPDFVRLRGGRECDRLMERLELDRGHLGETLVPAHMV
jgi:hypothetical protein